MLQKNKNAKHTIQKILVGKNIFGERKNTIHKDETTGRYICATAHSCQNQSLVYGIINKVFFRQIQKHFYQFY